MKLLRVTALLLVLFLFALFYAPAQRSALAQSGGATPAPGSITQISTYSYFAAGNYDGLMSVADLHRYGDFGLGTFNGVDGEMVVLDGKVYQIRPDGKPHIADETATTPFAVMTTWVPAASMPVTAGENITALEAQIDKVATDQNVFLAVRIDGTFSTLQLRSENPAQTKPYPILTDLLKGQVLFNLTNIKGTLVGFRSPTFAQGLSVAGYHFHFISADQQAGGHVLAVTTTGDDTFAYNEKPIWNIYLPESSPSFQPGQSATQAATQSATQAVK